MSSILNVKIMLLSNYSLHMCQ